MLLIEKMFAAANAVKAGESLNDAAKWKVVGLVVPQISIILGIAFQFMGLDVTDAQLNMVSAGLGTLGVLLNSYFHLATSTKVGL